MEADEYLDKHYEIWEVEFQDQKKQKTAIVCLPVRQRAPLQPYDNGEIAVHEARDLLEKSDSPGTKEMARTKVVRAEMRYD